MKTRKIVSAALAGAMMMSMSVTAFAEQATTMAMEGATAAPTIKVDVPTSAQAGKVVLNPYGLKVVVGTGKAQASDTETVTDQVAAKVTYLTNLSDADLKVGIAGTATASTGVTLAAAPLVDTAAKPLTTKSVFMYYDVLVADDTTSDLDWPEAYDKTKGCTVLAKTAPAAAAIPTVTLAKAQDDGTAATANAYAAIHIGGAAATSPTTPWADTDKVDVSFAFTFTPTVLPTT